MNPQALRVRTDSQYGNAGNLWLYLVNNFRPAAPHITYLQTLLTPLSFSRASSYVSENGAALLRERTHYGQSVYHVIMASNTLQPAQAFQLIQSLEANKADSPSAVPEVRIRMNSTVHYTAKGLLTRLQQNLVWSYSVLFPGPDPAVTQLSTADWYGQSPCHVSLLDGDSNAGTLFSFVHTQFKGKVSVQEQDSLGRNILHVLMLSNKGVNLIAVMDALEPQEVSELLNCRDDYGMTPFLLGVATGAKDALEAFFSKMALYPAVREAVASQKSSARPTYPSGLENLDAKGILSRLSATTQTALTGPLATFIDSARHGSAETLDKYQRSTVHLPQHQAQRTRGRTGSLSGDGAPVLGNQATADRTMTNHRY